MNRRDTIIVAVLVNAALLTVLFATAVRTGPESKKETRTQLALAKSDAKPVELGIKQKIEKPTKNVALLDEYITAPAPSSFPAQEEILFSLDDIELELASDFASTSEETIQLNASEPREVVTKSSPESQYVQVTVKKGDFLEKIAKANQTSVAAIMKANQLTSSQLKIGQVLKVPLNGEKSSVSPSSPAAIHHDEYYIVREGDNPWLIASRNKLKLEELLRLNGLDEQKAKRLRPGDKLKIR